MFSKEEFYRTEPDDPDVGNSKAILCWEDTKSGLQEKVK